MLNKGLKKLFEKKDWRYTLFPITSAVQMLNSFIFLKFFIVLFGYDFSQIYILITNFAQRAGSITFLSLPAYFYRRAIEKSTKSSSRQILFPSDLLRILPLQVLIITVFFLINDLLEDLLFEVDDTFIYLLIPVMVFGNFLFQTAINCIRAAENGVYYLKYNMIMVALPIAGAYIAFYSTSIRDEKVVLIALGIIAISKILMTTILGASFGKTAPFFMTNFFTYWIKNLSYQYVAGFFQAIFFILLYNKALHYFPDGESYVQFHLSLALTLAFSALFTELLLVKYMKIIIARVEKRSFIRFDLMDFGWCIRPMILAIIISIFLGSFSIYLALNLIVPFFFDIPRIPNEDFYSFLIIFLFKIVSFPFFSFNLARRKFRLNGANEMLAFGAGGIFVIWGLGVFEVLVFVFALGLFIHLINVSWNLLKWK